MHNSGFRQRIGVLLIGLGFLTIGGCDRDPVSGKVYHQEGAGPVTIAFDGGKAKVDVMGESKTLDYKIEGDKITILDKSGTNIELTRQADGTLTGPMGTLRTSK